MMPHDVRESSRRSRVSHHKTAVVIAHEIHGVNRHIEGVAAHFSRYACDVFTPDFLTADSVVRQAGAAASVSEETVYRDFVSKVGLEAMTAALTRLCQELRDRYERVVCVGFSVGATSAWLSSSSGAIDATVCIYGSRIRDHPELTPGCPCLLIFAAREPNIDIAALAEQLAHGQVSVDIYEHGHGFCNPDHPNYAPAASRQALDTAAGFLDLSPRHNS